MVSVETFEDGELISEYEITDQEAREAIDDAAECGCTVSEPKYLPSHSGPVQVVWVTTGSHEARYEWKA